MDDNTIVQFAKYRQFIFRETETLIMKKPIGGFLIIFFSMFTRTTGCDLNIYRQIDEELGFGGQLTKVVEFLQRNKWIPNVKEPESYSSLKEKGYCWDIDIRTQRLELYMDIHEANKYGPARFYICADKAGYLDRFTNARIQASLPLKKDSLDDLLNTIKRLSSDKKFRNEEYSEWDFLEFE